MNQQKPAANRDVQLSLEAEDGHVCICDVEADPIQRIRVQLPEQTVRVANYIWRVLLWYRDKEADRPGGSHSLDSVEQAYHIVHFWENGTASNFEKKLIELYLAGDDHMKTRLALLFPAMVQAIDDWRSNKATFRAMLEQRVPVQQESHEFPNMEQMP